MPSVLADNALTTLANVKEEYAAISKFSDGVIIRRINAVSNTIENFLRRKLGYRVTTVDQPEYQPGRGYSKLFLDRLPIYQVTQIIIHTLSDIMDVGEPDDEYTRSDKFDQMGLLYRSVGWPSRPGILPDMTRDVDTTNLAYNIEVAYIAGFWLPWMFFPSDSGPNPTAPPTDPPGIQLLPADIESVCIDETIASLLKPKSYHLIEEKTPGGWMKKYPANGTSGIGSLSKDSKDRLLRTPLVVLPT